MPNSAASVEDRNATASWSGYVYQGKVGILVALKNMSELYAFDEPNIETSLDGWSLAFETFEDFDIKSPEGVVSRHQVKAKKVANAHLKGSYSTALSVFDATGCPQDKRYLHTVCAITNWDESTVLNPSDVQLYEYPDGDPFCDLESDEIQQFALNYLRILKPGAIDGELTQIYFYLQALLLDEINNSHTRNPVLDLKKLYLSIKDSLLDEVQDELQSIRLKNLLVKYLDELQAELESNGEDLGISWSEAESQVDALCSLGWKELKRFLMDIHPANATFEEDMDINSAGFKEVFLDLLRNTEKQFNPSIRGYQYNKETYVASTISDDERGRVEIARRVIKNPNNAKVMFEGKNIVTKNIQYDFSELTGGERGLDHRETILDPASMKFVKLDEALSNFSADEEE
jgi:hypothetical protein